MSLLAFRQTRATKRFYSNGNIGAIEVQFARHCYVWLRPIDVGSPIAGRCSSPPSSPIGPTAPGWKSIAFCWRRPAASSYWTTTPTTRSGITTGSTIRTMATGTAFLGGLTISSYTGLVPAPQEYPGLLGSFIPFWGSGRAYLYDLHHGNYYGSAAINGAFFITDLFLIRSLMTGVAQSGWREVLTPSTARFVSVRHLWEFSMPHGESGTSYIMPFAVYTAPRNG